MRNTFLKGTAAGIVSGFFLGFFLKAVQAATGIKVYTLLLNVDYIPLVNRFVYPEVIEFAFHLAISVLLTVALFSFLEPKRWSLSRKAAFLMAVSIMIGLLLFLTTALSERTPALHDEKALSYWLSGHALYGLAASLFLHRQKEPDEN